MHIKRVLASATVSLSIALFTAQNAKAGPFIFAGTDADDHGSATSTANQDGWLFMQRAIENLGSGITNGNKIVVSLGSDPGSQAGGAALSAFNFSSLKTSGYTFLSVNGEAAINSFFVSGIATAAIILLDSSDANVVGGLSTAEEAAITANATTLNNFLGMGGGLFSQANDYGFLSALVPGLGVSGNQDQGISLTASGNAAFPSLTNADLSAGPYHDYFTNTGAIPILGVGQNDGGRSIIIGASGGTITAPGGPMPVPEPATLALLGGLTAMGMLYRQKRV